MKLLPMTSDGARRVSVDFGEDQGVFILRTYWNPTAKIWFCDLLDQNEVPLVSGVALTPNVPLLRPYPEPQDAIGDLRIADLAGTGNAGPETLGNDAVLVQVQDGELPAESSIYAPIVDLEDILQ